MAKPPNYAGSIRRSQVITTYGPGAIINLRSPAGAPISGVAGGLEAWDQSATPPGLKNRQRCYLSRLQKKLGVDGFRLPPVGDDRLRRDAAEEDWKTLVASRFPHWLTCPSCNSLAPARKWRRHNDKPDPARWCGKCSTGTNRVYAVPVRFILTCNNGHLEEFPWKWWLRQRGTADDGTALENCGHNRLFLTQGSSLGLSSLTLRCRDCNGRASMGGIFKPDAFQALRCAGNSPWLPGDSGSKCSENMRAVQRNSSSLYLPKFESAIDIPPWTHILQEKLGDWWPRLAKYSDAESRGHYLTVCIDDINEECFTNYTVDQLNADIQSLQDLDDQSDDDLKVDEYALFVGTEESFQSENKEFQVRVCEVGETMQPVVDKVLAVERLREVRSIYGFSRLKETNNVCMLSNDQLRWLPATEVRGEGIFINFRRDWIDQWASNAKVQERFKILEASYAEHAANRGIAEEDQLNLTPEFILIHSLSHLLIRQISLECGYSTASLSERLYAHDGMSGVLIYTSTADSDGTLGGLCRLAQPDRLERIFALAIASAEWCSSDPLCMEGVTSYSEPLNLAACHACLLMPETTCEHLNYFLDRALVPGIPEDNLPPFMPTSEEDR